MSVWAKGRTAAGLGRRRFVDAFEGLWEIAVGRVLHDWVRASAESVLAAGAPAGKTGWEEKLLAAQLPLATELAVESYRMVKAEFGGKVAFRPWSLRAKARPKVTPTIDPELILARLRPKIQPFLERTNMLLADGFSERLTDRYEELRAELATVSEIAKAFREEGLREAGASAKRTARTLTVWNHNEAAMLGYLDSGVKQLEWLTTVDELACGACVDLNGKVVQILETFARGGEEIADVTIREDVEHPPAHTNCLAGGETPVLAPGKVAGLVAAYRGPVAEVGLANGRRLTVTPNHLLLTPYGFARAQSLREGDYVLYCPSFERMVSGDPDDDRKPARIQEAIETLAKVPGMMARRMPVASEDLHGDARFCQGYIDIVRPDSLAEGAGKPALFEGRGQDAFNPGDASLPGFPGAGGLASVLQRLAMAADGIMGGRGESRAFSRRQAGHADTVGFASGAGRDSTFQKPAADNAPVYAKGFAERQFRLSSSVALRERPRVQLDASRNGDALAVQLAIDGARAHLVRFRQLCDQFSGLVTAAKVLRVRQYGFSGHVYDLQTRSSLYIANGVLSSNCRCVLLPVI